jgi:hypothetical protein
MRWILGQVTILTSPNASLSYTLCDLDLRWVPIKRTLGPVHWIAPRKLGELPLCEGMRASFTFCWARMSSIGKLILTLRIVRRLIALLKASSKKVEDPQSQEELKTIYPAQSSCVIHLHHGIKPYAYQEACLR